MQSIELLQTLFQDFYALDGSSLIWVPLKPLILLSTVTIGVISTLLTTIFFMKIPHIEIIVILSVIIFNRVAFICNLFHLKINLLMCLTNLIYLPYLGTYFQTQTSHFRVTLSLNKGVGEYYSISICRWDKIKQGSWWKLSLRQVTLANTCIWRAWQLLKEWQWAPQW